MAGIYPGMHGLQLYGSEAAMKNFTDEEIDEIKEDAWHRMRAAALTLLFAVVFWLAMGILCWRALSIMAG